MCSIWHDTDRMSSMRLGHSGREHPVVVEIRERSAGVVTGNCLVLAVAGGGMRGVVTGGMLAGLEQAGVTPGVFDEIVGVSAGAVGSAYFVAGAATYGVRIYWEHLAQQSFVDKRRALLGRPVMDLDFLFSRVLCEDVALNAQAVVDAGNLKVVVSSPYQVGAVTLGPARSPEELFGHLRASCHVPVLAGRAPVLQGEPLFDGSLTEPIPVGSALARGATHVLVLSSTPSLSARRRQSVPEMIVSRGYNLRFPGIHKVIASQVSQSGDLRKRLRAATEMASGPPYLLEVAPQTGSSPSPLCCNAQELQQAYLKAVVTVRNVLGISGECAPL